MNKTNFYQLIKQIDDIISSGLIKENEEKLFMLIKKNVSVENYFFSEVSDIDWFYPLKDNGYFNPEKAPCPKPAEEEGSYYVPRWNVLPYLEKLSNEVTKQGNERYIDELLEIIKNVSNYKDESGKHIDNYHTWWYFVKILSNIPNEKITDEIIDLIPIWLDSRFETSLQGVEIINLLLPTLLTDKSDDDEIRKAESIINYITELKTIPLSEEKEKLYGKREEFQFKLDSYWLEKAFEKHEKLMAEKCSVKVIEDLVEKIEKMLEGQADGAYRSFYKDDQVFEPLDLLTNALKNILNEKAKLRHDEIKEILTDFIKNNFYYFQKIALYTIGQNINKLKDIIWEYMNEIIGDSVQRNYLLGDELKNLLMNLQNLTYEQKEIIKSKVEKGPSKDIPEKDPEKSKFLWKQKIYQALSTDSYFKRLYYEIREKTKEDTELTPGVVWLGMKSGREEAPLSSEEIMKKSNEALARLFSEFKNEDFWIGPTVDGLSDMLKKAVKQNPDKFLYNMNPFLNSGYLYIYDILLGFREAWKDKKSLDWASLFKFVKDYIKQDQFWTGKLRVKDSHWSADYEWVLSQIGELIQEGTKDDSWAFDQGLLPKAEEILFIVIEKFLENPPKEDKEESYDPITYALNSAAGNVITALIFLALRTARVEKREIKEGESRWSSELKNICNKFLDSPISEAYTLLGQYIYNFWYLDKNWARKQISKIESEEDQYWSNFISGYLWGNVYLDFYDVMKGHYKRAVEYQFKEKTAEDRLIQHIAVLYLSDVEQLKNDSLIYLVIEKSKSSHIDVIVKYFRGQFQKLLKSTDQESNNQEKDKISDMRNKIIEFWKSMYRKYEEKKVISEEDRQVLTYLLMLTISLPKINDEKFKWIMLSILHLRKFYRSNLFIQDLNSLKGKGDKILSGRFIGQILKKLVEISPSASFKNNIHSLVEFLCFSDDQETKQYGIDICIKYAEHNIYDDNGRDLFLRDIYEKCK